MNLLNQFKLPAIAGILFVVSFISSCEQDLTTVGEGVIGGEPFVTGKAVYGVQAFNRKIEAVQTNKLPIYQLGIFNDPIYGKTEARITSQVQLRAFNPTFGVFTQAAEIDSDVFENETIDSVVVYIPFINGADSDNDGVPNDLEVGDDILDATNDSDGDGLANNAEVARGTNPLKTDTDGDGVLDAEDETNEVTVFAERVGLDSIYGNRDQEFTFKIERSTYFLRDLDPSSNFQNAQEYYSDQQFSPDFTDEILYEGSNSISDLQTVIITAKDDPDTSDADETVKTALSPGIRVQLDPAGVAYFQTNILDKEGGSELQSDINFKNFFRGVNLSVTPSDSELLFFLSLTDAQIEVYYHYDKVEDSATIIEQSSFNMSLLFSGAGNAVNTFINDSYPPEITNAMDSEENASRIYLKGGAGSFAEIKLFEDEAEIADIKTQNWVINEAHLIFYVDQEAFTNADLEPPRLFLYNAETNEPLFNILTENSSENTALGVYLNYDGILEESDNKGVKYTVNITEHLNNIIVRDSVNATLGLQVSADIRLTNANNVRLATGEDKVLPVSSILTPLGTVLFGSNVSAVEEANKLQLEIFYTETN